MISAAHCHVRVGVDWPRIIVVWNTWSLPAGLCTRFSRQSIGRLVFALRRQPGGVRAVNETVDDWSGFDGAFSETSPGDEEPPAGTGLDERSVAPLAADSGPEAVEGDSGDTRARVEEDASPLELDTIGDDDLAGTAYAPRAVRETLVSQAAETQASLIRIEGAVQEFQARTAAAEDVNRKLHSRVETLQKDQVRSLLKPVFERLANLHTQAVDAARRIHHDSDSSAEFEYFAGSIEELLDLYDLESVEAEVGQPLDTKKHHATRPQVTDQPDLEATIQRVQRQGFAFRGADRVFLPARVGVYRYVESDEERSPDDSLLHP